MSGNRFACGSVNELSPFTIFKLHSHILFLIFYLNGKMKMIGHKCIAKRITDILSVQCVFFKKKLEIIVLIKQYFIETELLNRW